MMKVCYVTNNDFAGAAHSLLDLLAGLRDTDVEPVVLLNKFGPMDAELEKIGVKYCHIPFCFATKSTSWIKTLVKRAINIISPHLIAVFLKREQIDVLHNNCFMLSAGMKAAKLAKIPYICHLRDLVQEGHHVDFINEQRQMELLICADRVISISNFVYQKYVVQNIAQKFITIYDGMNVSNYLNVEHEIFCEKNINILMAGAFAPMKGQLEAVQAIHILKKRGISNLSLKLVGADYSMGGPNGKYLAQVTEYISSNQINQIELLPFANGIKELRGLRAESDINLMCSGAEAMGRVTIESQLAGCLTIGANAGATPELIQDGETGLLYKWGHPEDLADKIEYAITHTGEMRKIARAGRQYAKETYDCYAYGQKILEMYREILKIHSK